MKELMLTPLEIQDFLVKHSLGKGIALEAYLQAQINKMAKQLLLPCKEHPHLEDSPDILRVDCYLCRQELWKEAGRVDR